MIEKINDKISKNSVLNDAELENISGGRNHMKINTDYRCPVCGKHEVFIGEQPEGRTCWVCGGQGTTVVMERNVIYDYC